MTKRQKKILFRICISSLLVVLASIIPLISSFKYIDIIKSFVYLISYLVIGYDILIQAFKGILRGQAFDENFLMAIATLGALFLNEYLEASAVMLFYQIGELFQSCAINKSRKNISELIDLRPEYVNLEDADGSILTVEPEEVEVGSIIVIKVGEKVPIDGVITDGNTTLDTSALTGESVPIEVFVGDEVSSGCINVNKVIKVRTLKRFEDSTVSKILDLIENAGNKKANPEKFISRFAKYYTPVVCISALLLALIPPLVNLILNNSLAWQLWLYRALTFLVISCPCALVISIPLSFFSAIGGAGKIGILIKGSSYIDTLSKVKYVVTDKTGTLTEGVFKVEGIYNNTYSPELLLEYTALAEAFSTHPISKSIIEAYGLPVDVTRVADLQEVAGKGIIATVDGHNISVGNEKLMQLVGVDFPDFDHYGTKLHVSIDSKYAGVIVISDAPKKSAKKAVSQLKKIGAKEVIMLTGDKESVADQISKDLCIDKVYSDLLPQDKISVMEDILSSCKKGETLVYVGDGVNDAPVLARADVGIAMGALGSDCAIEASDIVLMDDDPMKIVKAIKLSKKCMRIVFENIYFSLGIKFLCLALGALGFINMWFAIFADVGVMVLAVLNSIRVLNVKNL